MQQKPETHKKQEQEFPREITFKAVYKNQPQTIDTIKSCLGEKNISYTLTEKFSANGKFISYTVSSYFENETLLHDVCSMLKSIEGFMMMF
jgi:putative lipoic acid-binding regulatory protein